MARRTSKQKLHVNVYEVDRCYGGPEEGGWYYDCGEPVASRVVKRGRQAQRVQKQLEREYCPPGGKRHRSYMRCAYRVRVERGSGAPFPRRRPYYE